MQDETRRVVESYFAAWTARKTSEAYGLLAEDLEFTGPTASYQSAAAFRPALGKSAGTKLNSTPRSCARFSRDSMRRRSPNSAG